MKIAIMAMPALLISLARGFDRARSAFVKKTLSGLAAATLLFASLGANAIMVSVAPSAQAVSVGDSVFVDVVISGLGTGVGPTLGAFDIDVLFDTALLAPTSVVFGTGLDVLGLGSIQGVAGSGPVNVFEVSLDTPAALTALQPGVFTLFTLTFDAIAAGVSGIDLVVNDLSNAFGRPARFVTVEAGEITVRPVPLPATLLLFGVGLVGFGFARRGSLAR